MEIPWYSVLFTAYMQLAAGPGGGAMGFFCAGSASATPITSDSYSASCPAFKDMYAKAGCLHGAADCMLNVTLSGARGVASRNLLALALPSSLRLPRAVVTHTVLPAEQGAASVRVKLSTNATAVYVWLTTAEHGRFSDNAFMLRPGEARGTPCMPPALKIKHHIIRTLGIILYSSKSQCDDKYYAGM